MKIKTILIFAVFTVCLGLQGCIIAAVTGIYAAHKANNQNKQVSETKETKEIKTSKAVKSNNKIIKTESHKTLRKKSNPYS